jgi:hypothetical protein
MAKSVSQIHKGKTPYRRHFINEWLEAREMEPMALLDLLNEADTSLPPVDKSQVYRWLKGQLPQKHMQERIAGALGIVDVESGEPDPSGIFRDPTLDWFSQKVKDRSEDELKHLRQIVDAAFPSRTGTRN